MEEHAFERQGQVAVHVESTSFSVAPGGSVTVPLLLHNQGAADEFFELSVRGIPSNWVSAPSLVTRLASGEQREVALTIQLPPSPQGRVGRHPFVIRVASQGAPEEAAEVACTLTVAALEVPGRIGILLASTEFSVAPGSSTAIPIVLLNRGLEDDVFTLSVDGILSTWVYSPSMATRLSPGQQQEVSLTIQPPRSLQTRAGRHPFRIQVSSQATAGQVAEAGCILTIATFSEFSSELRPQRIEAGEPGRVAVENRGNTQQAFTLTWQSPNDELTFDPGQTQKLRVPPGEVAMAEFRASPRKRSFFGGEMTRPFTARVQSADRETQNLSGEVVSRALVPSWVLPAVLAVILAIACISVSLVLLGRSPEGAPVEPPIAQATATVEQPAPPEVPTVPPPQVPTEPPPEAPTAEPPPEAPTAEPPPEEPPVPEHLPAEPGEGGQPCAPLALGLVVVPLLVVRKRGRR
jgi:hypothetical protein